MRQLIFKGNLAGKTSTRLDLRQTRYLARVLRMGRGDTFEAIDEFGTRFLCELTVIDARGASILLRERAVSDAEPSHASHSSHGLGSAFPRIALVQALPKGAKLDTIIRQAAELGIHDIFPLRARHCVAREDDPGDREEKRARREKIIIEARQQSGSEVATKVHPSVSLEELDQSLETAGYSLSQSARILCHELPSGGATLHEVCAKNPSSIVVAIGPEGGFAPGEVELFAHIGFAPLHFEGPIMRTETAALFALSAIKIIVTERQSWTVS